MEDETRRKKRPEAGGGEDSYHEGIIDAEVQLPVAGPNHHHVDLIVFCALRRLEEELDARPQCEDCGIIAAAALVAAIRPRVNCTHPTPALAVGRGLILGSAVSTSRKVNS